MANYTPITLYPGLDGLDTALGVNSSGYIVGYLTDQNGIHGFEDDAFGTITRLSAYPQSNVSYSTGINDAGQIVGTASIGSTTFGWIETNGTYQQLIYPQATSTDIRGINASGAVVGVTIDSLNYTSGYMYDHGTFTRYVFGGSTIVNSINSFDDVAGSYTYSGHSYAFYVNHTSPTRDTVISITGATDSFATGINDQGQVVGNYILGGVEHGFIYSQTQNNYVTFDFPNSTSTTINGISNAGELVGSYIDSGGITHAFEASTQQPTVKVENGYVTLNSAINGTAGYGGSGALSGDFGISPQSLSVVEVVGGSLSQKLQGIYGHLTLNSDGSYAYIADNSQLFVYAMNSPDPQDTFHFTVSDGNGGFANSTLQIHLYGSGTGSNEALFGAVTTDAHSAGGEVYAMYQGLLGRAPDTLGLEYWADQFSHGASPATLASAFLASAEGQARLGASDNSSFVQQLYQNTLNRAADSGGLSYWTDQLAHGASRVDVADSFVFSAEHTNTVQQQLSSGLFVPDANATEVARIYYTMLGRAPDASGLQYWTNQIEHGGGTASSVAQAFLGTPESQSNYGSLSNSAYVDALYVNALGRHADSGGLNYWTGQLNGGESRADLTVQLSESTEAQNVHIAQIEQGWHLT